MSAVAPPPHTTAIEGMTRHENLVTAHRIAGLLDVLRLTANARPFLLALGLLLLGPCLASGRASTSSPEPPLPTESALARNPALASDWANRVLARIEMDAPLYSRPARVGDALYLATAHRLYLIASKG